MAGSDRTIGEDRDDAEERDRLLRAVADARRKILQREGGDFAKWCGGLGWELLAPHIDAERVAKTFREQHSIDQFARLEEFARVGVPVDVAPRDNLERELAYGNNSADKQANEVWEKAVGHVKTGRVIVVPARLAGMVRGLQINLVGALDEKGKRGIIYDSTFSGEPEGGRVIETTYWDQISVLHLVDVVLQIVRGFSGGLPVRRHADAFGRSGSPGWCGVIASAIQQAQRQTTRASATILTTGVAATARVRVAAHTGLEVKPLPESCMAKAVEGRGIENAAWVVFCIDDAVSVEVQWEPHWGRCLVLAQPRASIEFEAARGEDGRGRKGRSP